eukprot:gene6878-2631_t
MKVDDIEQGSAPVQYDQLSSDSVHNSFVGPNNFAKDTLTVLRLFHIVPLQNNEDMLPILDAPGRDLQLRVEELSCLLPDASGCSYRKFMNSYDNTRKVLYFHIDDTHNHKRSICLVDGWPNFLRSKRKVIVRESANSQSDFLSTLIVISRDGRYRRVHAQH